MFDIGIVISATIFQETFKAEEILIIEIPIIIKRIQFPIRLAFAVSNNKSQGQSLSVRRNKFHFESWK